MDFQLIGDTQKWDEFAAGQKNAQFLQSWSWGEFQKAYGRRVWRVGIFEKEKMLGAAQIIEHNLGLGMGYLYCPKGPIIKFPISNFQFPIEDLLNFIKTKIVNYGHVFWRIEPNIQYPISNIQILRVLSIQPTHTLLIDLSLSEEELLKQMHPKTRYNLHLAERKGLEFENVILSEAKNLDPSGWRPQDDDGATPAINHLWPLFQETARRDKIRLHPRRYYELMLRFVPCSLFLVLYQSQPLSSGLFIGFGDTFTYVHGASSSERRELMAPYLLHWQAIKFAKNHGYRYYDFGGINPEDKNDFDYRSCWEGITRFKNGFSGEIVSSAGAYEVVLSKRGYRIYHAVKKIRGMLS